MTFITARSFYVVDVSMRSSFGFVRRDEHFYEKFSSFNRGICNCVGLIRTHMKVGRCAIKFMRSRLIYARIYDVCLGL